MLICIPLGVCLGTYGDRKGLSYETCSGLCPIGFYCPAGTVSSTQFRCPAGRYGSERGLKSSSCTGECAAGYYCKEGSVSPTQFQCGVIDVVDGALLSTSIQDGTVDQLLSAFTNLSNTSSKAAHDVYLNSFDVSVTPVFGTLDVVVMPINPNNYFCLVGSGSPTPVLPGYYTTGGNQTTRSGQLPCRMGSYCVGGVVRQCPAGTFGRSDLLATPECSGLCAKGHYCPAGSISSTEMRCPLGMLLLGAIRTTLSLL
jgi:hypothetical protein